MDILLQIPVKELVIVQMINSILKNGKPRRIFLRRHIRHLQRAPDIVDISAGEGRDLFFDLAAVIGKAGSQIQALIRRGAVRLPVSRIDGQRLRPLRDH